MCVAIVDFYGVFCSSEGLTGMACIQFIPLTEVNINTINVPETEVVVQCSCSIALGF